MLWSETRNEGEIQNGTQTRNWLKTPDSKPSALYTKPLPVQMSNFQAHHSLWSFYKSELRDAYTSQFAVQKACWTSNKAVSGVWSSRFEKALVRLVHQLTRELRIKIWTFECGMSYLYFYKLPALLNCIDATLSNLSRARTPPWIFSTGCWEMHLLVRLCEVTTT